MEELSSRHSKEIPQPANCYFPDSVVIKNTFFMENSLALDMISLVRILSLFNTI